MEVTGATARFYDAVCARVARMVVVNAQQFQVISASVKKTDWHDTEALRLYVENDLLRRWG